MNRHVSEADLIGEPRRIVTKADAETLAAALDAAATMYLWVSDEAAGIAPEDLDAIDVTLKAAHEIIAKLKGTGA